MMNYPLQKPKEQRINQYSIDDYDLMGKRILIVEDNPLNQMIMQMMMGNWKNTTVSLANNGLACLEIMKKQAVDLVLMDLHMPVMDGYETVLAIRKKYAGAENVNVPIIIITDDITKATRKRVFCLGVADYLNKPTDEKILYQKIISVLSKEEILFSRNYSRLRL